MIDPVELTAASSTTAQLQMTIGENQGWLSAMGEESAGAVLPPTPGALGRFGIDGAGFLVFDQNGQRTFAKAASMRVRNDGTIVSDSGAALLGYPIRGTSTRSPVAGLAPIRVPLGNGAVPSCMIDQDGSVTFVPAQSSPSHPQAAKEIGRIAIAVFASPDRLERTAEAVTATPLSGAPQYLAAGAAHVGTVRGNPPRWDLEAMRANLRALWVSSGQADIDVALVASADALARTALNLVR